MRSRYIGQKSATIITNKEYTIGELCPQIKDCNNITLIFLKQKNEDSLKNILSLRLSIGNNNNERSKIDEYCKNAYGLDFQNIIQDTLSQLFQNFKDQKSIHTLQQCIYDPEIPNNIIYNENIYPGKTKVFSNAHLPNTFRKLLNQKLLSLRK